MNDAPAVLTVDHLSRCLVDRQDALLGRMRSLPTDAWTAPTRCPGWRVRDVAWHVAWGRGPGEVIDAARARAAPVPYLTARIGPVPEDADLIVEAMRAKCEATRADLASLADSERDMTVRYGNDEGQPLRDFLWLLVVEAFVHGDDLDTAVGVDEPMDRVIAEEIVRRLARSAVRRARADGLQPKRPRGYAYVSDAPIAGFHFDGTEWAEGTTPHPTCTFEGDPTTLARLVMGRIPLNPWEATRSRLWDDRLRITGDVAEAPPMDVLRWCYGAW